MFCFFVGESSIPRFVREAMERDEQEAREVRCPMKHSLIITWEAMLDFNHFFCAAFGVLWPAGLER